MYEFEDDGQTRPLGNNTSTPVCKIYLFENKTFWDLSLISDTGRKDRSELFFYIYQGDLIVSKHITYFR